MFHTFEAKCPHSYFSLIISFCINCMWYSVIPTSKGRTVSNCEIPVLSDGLALHKFLLQKLCYFLFRHFLDAYSALHVHNWSSYNKFLCILQISSLLGGSLPKRSWNMFLTVGNVSMMVSWHRWITGKHVLKTRWLCSEVVWVSYTIKQYRHLIAEQLLSV